MSTSTVAAVAVVLFGSLSLVACKTAEKEYYACPPSEGQGDQLSANLMCHARVCAKYAGDKNFGDIACKEFGEACSSARYDKGRPLMANICKTECDAVYAQKGKLDKFHADVVEKGCGPEKK